MTLHLNLGSTNNERFGRTPWHGIAEGDIFRMFRLVLALPLRGIARTSLNMTRSKCFSSD